MELHVLDINIAFTAVLRSSGLRLVNKHNKHCGLCVVDAASVGDLVVIVHGSMPLPIIVCSRMMTPMTTADLFHNVFSTATNIGPDARIYTHNVSKMWNAETRGVKKGDIGACNPTYG